MKRVAFYLRVSTGEQSVENQSQELYPVAQRHGWDVVKVYTDLGVSGAKSRKDRPAFDQMCRALGRKEFDLIAAWSVDRLGRSLQDLIAFLSEIHAKNVDLYLHQQGLDTTTPAGRALYQMLGVFSEFERAIIQERIRAGLRRAQLLGVRLGRPAAAAQPDEVNKLREQNLPWPEIARRLSISVSTAKRLARRAIREVVSGT